MATSWFKQPKTHYFLSLSVTLILTVYQLIRVIAFVNIYGGLEHDSGWFLSISRSLAEQGTYTTMVSTIADPAALSGVNVDRKFDIQAADGRIWFFTDNGTGPASIVPNALVLKIFGVNFWTLRAGPLIFYTLLLLTTAYILYQLAGIGAVLLFHLLLFAYPRLSIFLGYEAMGEASAMFYIVAAYLCFALAMQKSARRWPYLFVAGLLAGLAVNTKLLALLSISGIFFWFGWLWLAELIRSWRGDKSSQVFKTLEVPFTRGWLGEGLALAGGFALPLIVWEVIQFTVLIWLTNWELYLSHVRQRLRFVLDQGSGLGLRLHSGPEFMWHKFFILEEVAHPDRWVTALVFAVLLLGGLLWLWRSERRIQNFLAPIWLGWLANTLWFVSLAKTGWPRHFWFGLMLAAILLAALPFGLMWSWWSTKSQADYRVINGSAAGLGVLLLGLIGWGMIYQPHVWGFFLPDEIVPYWLERRSHYIDQVSLPWILIPRTAQAEVVDYIKQLPTEANVYYPYAHKGAEIPVLTGRIHYPLARRAYPSITPHPDDILLIPSFIVSPWTHDSVMRRELLHLIEQSCPQPVLKNDYYIICRVEALQQPP
jgi:hypothetical protein